MKKTLIPKNIYYVWLGRDPKDKLTELCIYNFKKTNPEFNIIEINEKVFNLEEEAKTNKFLRECIKRNLHAFITDYARIKILYRWGGFYCDTDIQLLRSLLPLVEHRFVITAQYHDTTEPAFFGCVKNHPLLKEILEFYEQEIWKREEFILPDVFKIHLKRRYGFEQMEFADDLIIQDERILSKRNVQNQSEIRKLTFSTVARKKRTWTSDNQEITILPMNYLPSSVHFKFCGSEFIDQRAYGIHWNKHSWGSNPKLRFLERKHLAAPSKFRLKISDLGNILLKLNPFPNSAIKKQKHKLLELFLGSRHREKLKRDDVIKANKRKVDMWNRLLSYKARQADDMLEFPQLDDKTILSVTALEGHRTLAKTLYPRAKYEYTFNTKESIDWVFQYGMSLNLGQAWHHLDSRCSNITFFEDGFICSVKNFFDKTAALEFRMPTSVMMDDLNFHFNAAYPSRIERLLKNEHDLSKEQVTLVDRLRKRIVGNKISKYNFQPIYSPSIGNRKEKVLVLDQSFEDMSVLSNGGNKDNFELMLEAAVKENPGADVIVKVHPDSLTNSGREGGYFSPSINKKYKNVFLFADTVNPYCLFELVEKVYVYCSGAGLEALLAGKKVVTFGCPFYAGWGLTDDRSELILNGAAGRRRGRNISLQFLTYQFYIRYTKYVNPRDNSVSDLDHTIDYLLEMREKYFKQNSHSSH